MDDTQKSKVKPIRIEQPIIGQKTGLGRWWDEFERDLLTFNSERIYAKNTQLSKESDFDKEE